jgi:hypothetical protein
MFSGCMVVAWAFFVVWLCAVLFGLVRFAKNDGPDRWFLSVFNPFVVSLILAMFFICRVSASGVGLITGCGMALATIVIGFFVLFFSLAWFMRKSSFEKWIWFAFPFTSAVVIVAGWLCK